MSARAPSAGSAPYASAACRQAPRQGARLFLTGGSRSPPDIADRLLRRLPHPTTVY
jgi:hypothetical protein